MQAQEDSDGVPRKLSFLLYIYFCVGVVFVFCRCLVGAFASGFFFIYIRRFLFVWWLLRCFMRYSGGYPGPLFVSNDISDHTPDPATLV